MTRFGKTRAELTAQGAGSRGASGFHAAVDFEVVSIPLIETKGKMIFGSAIFRTDRIYTGITKRNGGNAYNYDIRFMWI